MYSISYRLQQLVKLQDSSNNKNRYWQELKLALCVFLSLLFHGRFEIQVGESRYRNVRLKRSDHYQKRVCSQRGTLLATTLPIR